MVEGNMLEEDKGINLGESAVGVGEGHRGELVSRSDIKLVMEMTKDELNEYVMTRFGSDLNLSEKVKMLRLKTVNMIRDKLKIQPEAKPQEGNGEAVEVSANPEFLFNPANRRVLEWTANLATRADFIVCYIVDKDGKRL